MENQQPNQPDQPNQPNRPDQPDQSNVVPPSPAMQVPQVPPQFVTTQRRMFIVPSVTAMSLPEELPRTPMPGQPIQQSRTYVAPSVTFISLPQQIEQTPRPQFFSGNVPTCVPSIKQQPPMDSMLPQTPMPSAHTFTSGVYNITMPVPPKSFPGRPPISIPGSRSTSESRTEPGVSETLVGCAVLMVLAIFILAVLYYIAM